MPLAITLVPFCHSPCCWTNKNEYSTNGVKKSETLAQKLQVYRELLVSSPQFETQHLRHSGSGTGSTLLVVLLGRSITGNKKEVIRYKWRILCQPTKIGFGEYKKSLLFRINFCNLSQLTRSDCCVLLQYGSTGCGVFKRVIQN